MRTQKEYVRQSQQILRDNGIDPYWDRENLAYAPNDGHPGVSLRYMDRDLKIAYSNHDTKAAIARMLKNFTQRFIENQLPT